MAPQSRLVAGILFAGCLHAPIVLAAQPQPLTPKEAAAIVEFSGRVHTYADLHRRLEGPIPTIQVSEDPTAIRKAIDALGDAIRTARAGAKQGDLFSGEIAALFRRLIREGCDGRFGELLEMMHEETPPLPRPKVNGKWPGTAFTFMPPDLLCLFPPLPEELEYRFVNRDLVLWDVHADLIVDFISNAIPPDTDQFR